MLAEGFNAGSDSHPQGVIAVARERSIILPRSIVNNGKRGIILLHGTVNAGKRGIILPRGTAIAGKRGTILPRGTVIAGKWIYVIPPRIPGRAGRDRTI